MLQPSSPSCTVAGGAAGRGGENPFQSIMWPAEFLRWLLDDDDDGYLYRATMGAEAEAEAAPTSSSQSSMQQPSSPSCAVVGGAAGGGGEEPFEGIVIPPEYLRWLLDDDDGFLYRATTTAVETEASPPSSHSPMQRQPSLLSCTAAGGGAGGGGEEDPFNDIVIPPDLLHGLDDDDGCLHGAAAVRVDAEAEDEGRLSEAPQVGDHSPMQQPSSSPSCTVAGEEGAGGDEDPFDDIVMPPPDYLHGRLDDDGSFYGAEDDERARRPGEAQAGVDGGRVEEEDGLSMTYRGHTQVFDSVPPHKVETILMLLNDYELAPQSAKPKPTNLVPPIVVPQDFDRAVAMSRYRKKRKSTMKADYSVRREIALRIARRGGKFAPSKKSCENSVGTMEATDELQFCANCGESSEVTPQMRRGPTGAKNFCNACGLMWATTRKIRNVTNAESQHGGS